MTKKTAPSRLNEAILEMANDMHRLDIMDHAVHRKITLRHLGDQSGPLVEPMSGDDIRRMRETARLSQAVFARYLKLTTGYVSQLERGTKRPTGPALVLLNVIRRKGIEAIL